MSQINVLVVDDDETDRYIVRHQLAKCPQIGRVVEARDGAEAHAMFADGSIAEDLGPHPPQALVLLDINMPRMSGFELLERLQAEGHDDATRTSVIVMLTSSTYFGDKERAQGFPLVKGYIEKPLTVDDLRPYLDRLLDEPGPDRS